MHQLNEMKKERTELKTRLVSASREENREEMRRLFDEIKALTKTIDTLENIGASMDKNVGFTCGY